MSRKLTILTLALVATGCAPHETIQQAPQAVQTQRMQSDPSAARGMHRFSAVVEADAKVPLSFRIPGYVLALAQTRGEGGQMRDVAEGDRISRGTVLVRIRSAEYEDRVHQASSHAAAAEALAQKAKLDFERATHLYDSKSLTKPEFDAARAQHDAAQSELKAAQALTSEAEIALRDTSLAAPFNGDIVKKLVEHGSFVGPGTPLFVLARTDIVKIVIGVPDTAVASVRLGDSVDVTVEAYGDRAFQARISRLASAADPGTGNFEVEVGIPNPDHALKVGMIGSLQIPAREAGERMAAYRVPLSAIVQAGDGRYGVYVVSAADGGNVARLRPVEIGPVIGTEINVVRGLANGDEVITNGASLLKDGQRVEVLK